MFAIFAAEEPGRVRALWQQLLARHAGWRLRWLDDHCGALSDDDADVKNVESGEGSAIGRMELCGDEAESLLQAVTSRSLAVGDVSRWQGSYSIGIWDRSCSSLRAYRDPLGLAPLFQSRHGGALLLSDSLDVFANLGAHVDRTTAAAFIATGHVPPGRTIWQAVSPVEPGEELHWLEGKIRRKPFFRWAEARVEVPRERSEQIERCRLLMIDAVGQALRRNRHAWADLSGGHDSSSVASLAGWLGQRNEQLKPGGSISFVDSIGEGDETQYGDLVAHRYALKQIKVVDAWPWRSDGTPPPITESPTRDFPYWERDRRLHADLLRSGGACVMSGVGPDFFLPMTPAYAPDLLIRGRVGEAVDLLHRWTVRNRTSFWSVALDEVLTPFAPRPIQARLLRRKLRCPSWIRERWRAEFIRFQVERNFTDGWSGEACDRRVHQRLAEIGTVLHGWRATAGTKMRHPLLSLPLVQFCLSLERPLRTDYIQPKPILRFAMRGIVPDAILQRRTKGSLILPRVSWAFQEERDRIATLLRSPVLADLGIVDPDCMQPEIDACAAGAASARHLYFALSLETWLTTRAGRTRSLAA